MNYRKPAPDEKPRYRFCWLCSKKLWGNKFVYFTNVDGLEHITHERCAKEDIALLEQQLEQCEQDNPVERDDL